MNNEGPYQVDYELLGKHLAGECTPAEQEQVARWIAASPANRAEYEALAQVWGGDVAEPALVDVDAAWTKVEQRIAPVETPTRNLQSRRISRNWYAIAAILVVAIGLAWFYFQSESPSDPRMVNFTNTELVPVSKTLPDGSSVKLKPGASMSYAEQFSGPTRKVSFQGEGFFEVQKNSGKPFVVSVGSAEVRVLGTSFSLKEEDGVEVWVVEGSVQLAATGAEGAAASSIQLEAGQQGRFRASTQKLESATPLEPNELFWVNGRLDYQGSPLAEVARDLDRYYQVSLEFDNPKLADCPLTASFENDEIDSILEVITESMTLEAQKDGKKITLIGEDC